MNYILTGKRTVAGHLQTAVASLRGAAASSSQNFLVNRLGEWLAVLANFDGTKEATNMVYYNYDEFPNDETGNGYSKADITFSVLGKMTDGSLKTFCCKVENVTLSNASTAMQAKVAGLVNVDLTSSMDYVITNAVFDLHS